MKDFIRRKLISYILCFALIITGVMQMGLVYSAGSENLSYVNPDDPLKVELFDANENLISTDNGGTLYYEDYIYVKVTAPLDVQFENQDDKAYRYWFFNTVSFIKDDNTTQAYLRADSKHSDNVYGDYMEPGETRWYRLELYDQQMSGDYQIKFEYRKWKYDYEKPNWQVDVTHALPGTFAVSRYYDSQQLYPIRVSFYEYNDSANTRLLSLSQSGEYRGELSYTEGNLFNPWLWDTSKPFPGAQGTSAEGKYTIAGYWFNNYDGPKSDRCHPESNCYSLEGHPDGFALKYDDNGSEKVIPEGTYRLVVSNSYVSQSFQITASGTSVQPTEETVKWNSKNLAFSNPIQGKASNATLTLKPAKSFNLNSGQYNVYVDGIDFSSKQFTAPDGITVTGGNNQIEVNVSSTFELNAQTGLVITANNVTLPQKSNAYVSLPVFTGTYTGSESQNVNVTINTINFAADNIYQSSGISITLPGYETYKEWPVYAVLKQSDTQILSIPVNNNTFSVVYPDDIGEESATLDICVKASNGQYKVLNSVNIDAAELKQFIKKEILLSEATSDLTQYTFNYDKNVIENAVLYQSGIPITPYGGKYYLENIDNLEGDIIKYTKRAGAYKTGMAEVTVSGTTLTLNPISYAKNFTVSGTVKDSQNNPIKDAGITVTQRINSVTHSVSGVTGENGSFTINGLYEGATAIITVTAAGYKPESTSIDANSTDNVTVSLQNMQTIYVSVLDGALSAPQFTLKNENDDIITSVTNLGGTQFALIPQDVLTNVSYTLKVEADEYVNEVTKQFTYGGASSETVEITGNRKGRIINDYQNRRIFAVKDDDIVDSGYNVVNVPADTYSIYAVDVFADNNANTVEALEALYEQKHCEKTENVEIKAGEDFYITEEMINIAKLKADGWIKAPESALYGSSYKVEAIIENADRYEGLKIQRSANFIHGIVINGKVFAETGWGQNEIDISEYDDTIRLTFYCVQKSDAESIGVTLTDNDNKEYVLGSSVTRQKIELTLDVIKNTGNITEKDGVISAGNITFEGKTTKGNMDIDIYDNERLLCRVKSDVNGFYRGETALATSEKYHTIKAVTVSDGKEYTAKQVITYNPGGASLSEIKIGDKVISAEAQAPTIAHANTGAPVELGAKIDNDTLLENQNFYVDNIEKTGKVFFKVNYGSYTRMYLAQKQGEWWNTSVPEGFIDIEVVYSSEGLEKDNKVTVENEQIEFDNRLTSNAAAGEMFNWNDLLGQIKPATRTRSKNEETGQGKDSSELFGLIAANLKDDGDSCEAIDAEEAAKAGSDNYEYVTYVDNPSWEKDSQSFKVKELKEKGYEAYSYEENGKTIMMFKGTFYYAQDKKAVSNLYIQKVYNGIMKTEEDPRMFKNGKMIGSTLQVIYICDKDGKWTRQQAALIPPNAQSPIHTNKSQIPCKTDAPYSYSEAAASPFYADYTRGAKSSSIGTDNEVLSKSTTRTASKNSGLRFRINLKKVSAKTYSEGALIVVNNRIEKATKNSKWVLKADKNYEYYTVGVKGKKLKLHDGVTKMEVGIQQGQILTTELSVLANDAIGKTFEGQKPESLTDGLTLLRNKITKNLRYWGALRDDDIVGDNAKTMHRRSAEMLTKLSEVEDSIQGAIIQNKFTQDSTSGISWLSLVAALAPGVGTGASITLDSISFLMNAANDTRCAEAAELLEKFNKELEFYNHIDDKYKEVLGGLNREDGTPYYDKDRDEFKPGGKPDVKVNNVHDPSGIVYEAVLSNPIKDAKVTLYYADKDGKYIQENSTSDYNSALPVVHDDTPYLKQENPKYTDETGFYRWDVPPGLWLVKAEKDGYVSGDSQNDKEAKVTANGIKWLPVLPPQLNVNIPLMRYIAPVVSNVEVKSDGAYITFSTYMNESTLIDSNFTLLDSSNGHIPFTIEKLDSEKAPDNFDIRPSYTKTVQLKPTGSQIITDNVTVGVSNMVKSYADVPMEENYLRGSITPSAKGKAQAPTFKITGREVEKNQPVGINVPEGTKVYYTTDGTQPTSESTLYTSPIIISKDTTVKAVAVKFGDYDSDILEGTFKVKEAKAPIENSNFSGGGGGGMPAPEPKPELPVINADTEGGKTVLSEDGTTLTIIPDEGYEIKSVTVNGEDKGKVTTITGLKTGDIVAVEFVKTEKEPDKTSDEKAKGIIKKLKLDNSSKYTSKKNIKITCKVDVSELKKLGYKVKYKFYRSTKKSSGYKLKITKTSNTYINTKGKKGTKYYYKTKLAIYDKEGKLVETTAFKQSDVAYRTWKKK